MEKAILAMALDKPAYGQVRVANELTRQGQFVSPTGVRSVWLRHDMERFGQRLKALEAKAAQENLILTDHHEYQLYLSDENSVQEDGPWAPPALNPNPKSTPASV